MDSSENAIVYSVDADDYDPEATPYEPYTDDDGIGSYGIIPNEDSVCYAELELDKRECIPDKALPLSSSALRCDSGSSCMRLDDYENPLYGLHGFDNMAQSFFNVFMIMERQTREKNDFWTIQVRCASQVDEERNENGSCTSGGTTLLTR